MNALEIVKKVLLYISEAFFPADSLTKQLENMSVEEFISNVRGLSNGREVKDITILFEYHDPLVHHAIKALKFKGNSLIAKLLAKVIYESMLEELGDRNNFENFGDPILIPMPSSKERRNERGWNQCDLIGDELSILDQNANFKINKNVLFKNRYTESQIGKTRAERLKNLENSFSVKEKTIGKNIILFDDVVTTGATMSEAKRVLLESGARRVWCFAIAH